VLQITQLKDYENKSSADPKKPQFKFRYVLSDGVSSVKALVSEKVIRSMVSKKKRANLQDNPPSKYDVIAVQNMQRVTVQGQLLVMLKEPLRVVCSDLTSEIGCP
jgi:hypothetical protein